MNETDCVQKMPQLLLRLTLPMMLTGLWKNHEETYCNEGVNSFLAAVFFSFCSLLIGMFNFVLFINR